MTDEERLELETTLRDLRARQSVLEMILSQLIVRLSGLSDQPTELIRLVMSGAEDSLRHGREQATGALEVFENYSLRLIAALTPKQNPQ